MFYDLSCYGVLKVTGVDAKKLLQGQLTCDVEKITANHFSQGAHCDPKGRIISLFYLFERDGSYYLLMPRSMIPIALTALKKYALFYKVELTDASNLFHFIGQIEPLSDLKTNDYFFVLPVGKTPLRAILIQPKEKELPNSLHSFASWNRFNIDEKIPAIYPETSGKLLPHELNLQELGAISFDKGCYTGQEIIARMHYLGKLKTHLYLASYNSVKLPLVSEEIYSIQNHSEKMSGILIDACQVDANSYHILMTASVANAKSGHLFLKNNPDVFFTLKD